MRTVGIKLADGSFYPIMEEGSAQKKTLELTTAHNNQTCVMVDLYRSKNCTMEDAEYIDTLKIENLNEHPNGEPSISFDVGLDENGELSASIADPETGATSNSEITLVSRTAEERLQADDYSIADTDGITADEASDDGNGNGAAIAAGAAVAGAGLLAAAAVMSSNKDDDEAPADEDFNLGDDTVTEDAVSTDDDFSLPDLDNTTISEDSGLVADDAPVADDFTFDDEAPAADDMTIAEDAPAADDMTFAEDAPADDLTIADDAPVADDATIADDATFADDAPAADEMNFADDMPAADDLTFEDDAAAADDATVADDATIADDVTIPDDETFADEEMNFADDATVADEAPVADDDFSMPDLDDNLTADDTPAADDDFFNSDAADSEPTPSPASGLSFTGLYDKETEMGDSSQHDDDDIKKKTKAPVIICITCAIICIIATLLVLLVLPGKFNLRQRHSDKKAAQTEVTQTAEKKSSKDKKKDAVPEAKEDEVVVIEKAEDVKPVPPPSADNKSAGVTYKIKWGDTLWDIADTYYKNPWRYKKIASYNNIKNPDHIISGTVITIPAE